MLTPVENPTRLRPGRDRRATATSGGSSRSRTPDEITCNTINAGIYVLEPDTFDRIPKDTPWSIERSFFPSLIERGETFVAYVYRGYWIDIGTPEKYMQVHRDIMDGRYHAAAVRRRRRDGLGLARGARRGGRGHRGPVLHRRGRRRQGRRAHRPVQRHRPAVPHRGARGRRARRSSGPNTRISQEAVVRGSILGRHCHIGRNATRRRRRRARRQVGRHGLQPALDRCMPCSQSRHLQGLRRPRHSIPDEINEDAARARSARRSSPT